MSEVRTTKYERRTSWVAAFHAAKGWCDSALAFPEPASGPPRRNARYAIRPRRILLAAIAMALAACLWSVHCVGAEPKPLELKVMTFNIRYGSANDGPNHWDRRKDMVVGTIERHACDVIGLQEALRFQIDCIRRALPRYGEIGVAREDGKADGEYSALLYNRDKLDVSESATFWFSDTPDVPGSSHWGNACVRICSWARLTDKQSGRSFYAYNLHLDHVSQPSREKSVVLLAKRISQRKHNDPFIVTGDFNAGESNPAIRYLKGEIPLEGPDGEETTNPIPMLDSFRVLHPDEKEVGTFNGFKGTRTGDKIDFILVPPTVTTLDAAILHDNAEGQYPSDHFPAMAKLLLVSATR